MTGNVWAPSVFVYDPTDYPLGWLEDQGVKVTLGVPIASPGRHRRKWDPEELVAAAKGHEALLGASGAIISAEIMDALPELRCIAKLGVGYEVIDIQAATQRGILVATTPVHSEVGVVAEHALALILGLCKQLHFYGPAYIAGGGWKDPRRMARDVAGSTIGIVGLGTIGRAVATRAAGLGARILAYDVRRLDPAQGVEIVDLETLLRESDVVSLHVPGRRPGEGPLLGERELQVMKSGALLVNTARGNLVDKGQLVARLNDGRLGGYAADVYLPEPPPPDDPILSAPNVILTPHSAAWSLDVRRDMTQMAMENILAMLTGGAPESVVNPEAISRMRENRV